MEKIQATLETLFVWIVVGAVWLLFLIPMAFAVESISNGTFNWGLGLVGALFGLLYTLLLNRK